MFQLPFHCFPPIWACNSTKTPQYLGLIWSPCLLRLHKSTMLMLVQGEPSLSNVGRDLYEMYKGCGSMFPLPFHCFPATLLSLRLNKSAPIFARVCHPVRSELSTLSSISTQVYHVEAETRRVIARQYFQTLVLVLQRVAYSHFHSITSRPPLWAWCSTKVLQ